MDQPDISNLAACVEDAKQAALDPDPGPAEPTPYHSLLARLQAIRLKLPPLYRDAMLTPYVDTLNGIGEDGFDQVLAQDPGRSGIALLTFDIAQALLQRGERFDAKAIAAFQEVVSDLYDGFLSAEDRDGVEPPDHQVLPALVKFGMPDFGPYTWTIEATSIFGCQSAIVSLPPSNARRGLMAWPALSHETVGHDILHADTGLLAEMSTAVIDALSADSSTASLASYWGTRIDETASDVLGILNMGPAAAIGLIALFRGLNAAFGGQDKLRSVGPASDPHPADVLRGFLAAETVRLLSFRGAKDWASVLRDQTVKDVTTIVLEDEIVSPELAERSAKIVAKTIVCRRMASLENHSFLDIQDWSNLDEAIVRRLRRRIRIGLPAPQELLGGVFAAHVVAAATTAALEGGVPIPVLFRRMLDVLKGMNERNPAFGPLRVQHPGNVAMHRAYTPLTSNDDEDPAAGASSRSA